MNLIIIIFAAIFGSSLVDCSDPIVHIKNGAVRGVENQLPDGKIVNIYHSIRYGRAERFALPEPEGKWDDVYDATHQRASCPQLDVITHPEQSEDCLFLNVFQPSDAMDTKELKPVMVFIFGGGFTLGNIDFFLYDASYIVSLGDVIVVSMNYRLGAFGFLYLDDDDAPGNQGLHDQILSLKWVQENIEKFGGDPKQVTLFGESAGSLSISGLLVSPLAKGLFHRAILESGTLMGLAMFSPESTKEETIEFAHKVGCEQFDHHNMIECLRQKSVADLVVNGDGLDFRKMFEGKLDFIMWGDKKGLVPGKPNELIEKKENLNTMDLIIGFNHDELAEISVILEPDLLNPLAIHTRQHVRDVLAYLGKDFDLPALDDAIELYTKDLPLFPSVEQYRRTVVDFIGHPSFICPTFLWAEKWAQVNESIKVWNYRLDHRSGFMNVVGCLDWMGVCHGMDIPYVFGLPLNPNFIGHLVFTNEDLQLSKAMIKAWTNFAKNGDPGLMDDKVHWSRIDEEKGHTKTMSLKPEQFQIIDDAYANTCDKFWKQFLYPTTTTTTKM